MHKPALIVVALAVCAPVAAQTCTPREFSAYKADAKGRPLNRELLAMKYCSYMSNGQQWVRGSHNRELCDIETQKINDALTQANAYREINWAIKECPGDFADFKMKHYDPKTKTFVE